MIAKVVLFLVLATAVNADGLIGHMHHAPQPYKFGYSIKDHHGQQHRQESGNGVGGVVGSYGFTDARGILRQVNYVADHAGFRAQVKTNEPGTANQDPAAVNVISSAHPYYGAGIAGVGVRGAGYGMGMPVAGYGMGVPVAGYGMGMPVAGLGLGVPASGLGFRGVGLGAGRVYV